VRTPRQGLSHWDSRLALALLGLALLTVGLAGFRSAQAQDATPTEIGQAPPAPVTADDVNRVAKQLFCPVCENTPLDVCPTEACAQWRATIREKLEAGWTEQQIFDYFVAQYGERVLARPSTRGINILVWVVPPLALAIGAVGLWRYLKGAVRPKTAAAGAAHADAPEPEAAPGDDYARRLEQELKQRR